MAASVVGLVGSIQGVQLVGCTVGRQTRKAHLDWHALAWIVKPVFGNPGLQMSDPHLKPCIHGDVKRRPRELVVTVHISHIDIRHNQIIVVSWIEQYVEDNPSTLKGRECRLLLEVVLRFKYNAAKPINVKDWCESQRTTAKASLKISDVLVSVVVGSLGRQTHYRQRPIDRIAFHVWTPVIGTCSRDDCVRGTQGWN